MWIFDQDKRQDRRDVADLKEVLTTQLKALGEGRYELTLRTRDDQVSYAHVSAADILDRVRDLRAVNRAGTDVAIRPAERTGLVLLRDVPAAQVADLTQDGFPPVLLTEPAPGRFDAWVRVDSVGIQRGLHDSMAQVLAARYDLDTRTAGAEQAAALAGFTTRDDPDRRIPLVSADRESRVAPAALDLADWVLEHAQLDPALVDDQRGGWVPPDHRNEAARAAATRLDQVLGDRDPAARAEEPARWTPERPAPWDDRTAWQDALLAQQPVERPPAWVCERDGSVDLDAVDRLNPGVQSLLRAPYSREVAVAQGLDLDTLGRGEALSWVRENLDAIAEVPRWWHKGFRSPEAREEAMNQLADSLQAGGVPVERAVAIPVASPSAPRPRADRGPEQPAVPAAPGHTDSRGDRLQDRGPEQPAAPAAPPYAAQFGTLRRAVLAGSDGRLDERQAEWGAAHQLVDTYPQLTRDELVGALDKGGASGQGQGRTPPEREAYIARTAEKVLTAAHASPGQEGPERERERGQDRPQRARGSHGHGR